MVNRDVAEPGSLRAGRATGLGGVGVAGACLTFSAAWRDVPAALRPLEAGRLAAAGDRLAAAPRVDAGRLALLSGRRALSDSVLAGRFEGRLEELTPELPYPADRVGHSP
jgi:hypothetical protein